MIASRLGELLIREKMISAQQLDECLVAAKKDNARLIDKILSAGFTDEAQLIQFLSKHYKMTIMDLSNFEVSADVLKLLPSSLCVKNGILPVGQRGTTLVIAVSDPSNIQALDDVRFQTGLRVEQVLAYPSHIRGIIERVWGMDMSKLSESIQIEGEAGEATSADPEALSLDDQSVTADDAPIIQFVSALLTDAIRRKGSDIHIEPYETELRVRVRVDGDLVETVKPPANIKTALIARLKVLAKMRIDEKRLPQDGRIRFRLPEGKSVDLRVNSMPTIFGEKMVLRILDKSNAVMNLEQLGFEKDDLEKFMKVIQSPWGIVLVTGATGSGKTTTLYAALNTLNKPDVNISTIEDPVEYNFSGINQVQTKEHIGLTFATTLRALLRQDPDIILLGEIRDSDTAQIAIKASLTGHLVLSTLHTNDAPSTIMRLKDMGIETFLVNSALLAVLAQKLIRTICKDCKVEDDRYTDQDLLKIGFPQNVIGKFKPMRGKGCATCRNTGFKGRAAVHEIMVMTDSLKEKIGAGATTSEIRKHAMAEGMKTLKINVMRKIMRGTASIEELATVGDY